MSTHAGRKQKHPYMLDSFWINPNSWFWIGKNYTPESVKRFEQIVEDAITANDRWSKADNELRLHARK